MMTKMIATNLSMGFFWNVHVFLGRNLYNLSLGEWKTLASSARRSKEVESGSLDCFIYMGFCVTCLVRISFPFSRLHAVRISLAHPGH